MLVTLEGIDGSGKSTLHTALKILLADLDPIFTREPGATWVGDSVRRAIAEQIDPVTEATLFVADHAAHLATVVRPALKEGVLVISDRYSDSRYAYQSVTLQGIVPEPEKWLRAMHNGWTIIPDRTFLCVLPVDDALTRLKPDAQREHFEKREILEKVQNNYLAYAKAEPGRFVIVDAMLSPEIVAKFVADAIQQDLKTGKKRGDKKRSPE
ncbi:MAG: dTMP kinase [Methanoregula sp.]|uniref:dTMP kinase n=1 Tax=Methanoregula sp. TaxID=2052170 RepID=UPI0025F398EF|nr:dTMP kinase [Methanoregula sp.]MCK9630234.1 dTMP kinase [Methanoregula sp.]